jgi:hypothetical protein
MIVASCDIFQDMFSSVTELNRSVREPSIGCAHVMGYIVLLWIELSRAQCWVCPCDGCIVLLCVRVESMWSPAFVLLWTQLS